MNKVILLAGGFLRSLPDFKGKHRVGKILQRIFPKGDLENEVRINMKDGFVMNLDYRSATNNGAFWTGRYDSDLIRKFNLLFDSESIIMDVGANIGFYAIPFAKNLYKKGGRGRVYCFEPLNANYEGLIKNVWDNDLSDIVNIHKMALGDVSGTVELVVTEEGKTSNAVMNLSEEYSKGKGYAIDVAPIEKLDNLRLKEDIGHCDFIKIDIEGAEFFFVKGGYSFVEKFRPVIYGEFNSFFMEKFNCSFLDAWNLLEPLNYACFAQKGYSSYFEAASPRIGLGNVLLIPEGYDKSRLIKAGLIK